MGLGAAPSKGQFFDFLRHGPTVSPTGSAPTQPDATDTLLKKKRAQALASMTGQGAGSTLSTGGPVAASYGQPLKTLLGS